MLVIMWSMILLPFLVGKLMCWTRLKFSRISWYRFWGLDGSLTLMFVSPANIIVHVNIDTNIDSIVSILPSHSNFSICQLDWSIIPGKMDDFLYFPFISGHNCSIVVSSLFKSSHIFKSSSSFRYVPTPPPRFCSLSL